MLTRNLLLGDCVEVLKGLADCSVDSIVTDPPYGLDFPYKGYDDTRDSLRGLIRDCFPEFLRIASRRVVIMPGPTQIGLWPQADWVGSIVWNTTGSHGKYGFSQWTPLLFYGKDVKGFGSVNGKLKSDVIRISGGGGVGFQRSKEEKRHTCPKPLNMMREVIARYTEPETLILDPFMGSGTTGVACVMEGRNFIGIEREKEYLEISEARIKAQKCD
jgi:site-specific DNA-methyltransferase (adenine-specific)